jgi:hypothetical protein
MWNALTNFTSMEQKPNRNVVEMAFVQGFKFVLSQDYVQNKSAQQKGIERETIVFFYCVLME